MTAYRIQNQEYFSFVFELEEFAQYIDETISSKYSKCKYADFFREVYKFDPLLFVFRGDYQRLAPVIDPVEILGSTVNMSVAREFFDHPFPFVFPRQMLFSKSLPESRLKYILIESLASPETNKVINLNDAFYSKKKSSADVIKNKLLFVEMFNHLIQEKYIQSDLEVETIRGKKKNLSGPISLSNLKQVKALHFKDNLDKTLLS